MSLLLLSTIAGTGTHRYWRLNLTSTAGNAFSFAELQFRTVKGQSLLFTGAPIQDRAGNTITLRDSSNLITRSTVSATQTFDSGTVAANGIDNNIATFWSGTDTTLPQVFEYDYGVGPGLDIVEIVITARPDSNLYLQTPTGFDVQHSDDNITWVTKWSVTTAPWTAQSQVQTFDFGGVVWSNNPASINGSSSTTIIANIIDRQSIIAINTPASVVTVGTLIDTRSVVAINATAAVSISATHTPSGTSLISGVGSSNSTAFLIDTQSAVPVVGSGSVSINATHTPSASIAVNGLGSTTVIGTIVAQAIDTINGLAAVSVAATHTPLGSVGIAGSGNTVVIATLIDQQASIPINGIAAVSVNATHTPSGSVAINGISTTVLTANKIDTQAVIPISGSGLTSINATHTPSGVAIINAVGLVTTDAIHTTFGNVIINGNGSVNSVANKIDIQTTILINAIGTTAFFAAKQDTQSLIAISSSGNLIANATHTPSGAVAINGSGITLVTASIIDAQSICIINTLGQIQSTGFNQAQATATISGSASASVSATHNPDAVITINGQTIVSTDTSLVDAQSIVNIDGQGSVLTLTNVDDQSVIAIAGSGATVVNSILLKFFAQAALVGLASTHVDAATLTNPLSATINGSGSVISLAYIIAQSIDILSGNGIIISDSLTPQSFAQATLAGNGAINALATIVDTAAKVALNGQTSLTVPTTYLVDGQSIIGITGTTNVAAAASHSPDAVIQIIGSGNGTTNSSHTPFAASTIQGASTVVSDADHAPAGVGSCIAIGQVIVIPSVLNTHMGAALVGAGQSIVAADHTPTTAAGISGQGQVSSIGQVLAVARVTAAGQANGPNPTVQLGLSTAGTLQATATAQATAVWVAQDAAQLTATATVSVDSFVEEGALHYGAVTIIGTGAVSLNASAEHPSQIGMMSAAGSAFARANVQRLPNIPLHATRRTTLQAPSPAPTPRLVVGSSVLSVQKPASSSSIAQGSRVIRVSTRR